MEKLVEQIKAQYALFAENAEAQVSKNNKAAGTRARKAALEIMKLMKEFRKASVEAAKYHWTLQRIRAVPSGQPLLFRYSFSRIIPPRMHGLASAPAVPLRVQPRPTPATIRYPADGNRQGRSR